jgi:hypothetical protein
MRRTSRAAQNQPMPARQPSAHVHVEPRPGGRWIVRQEGDEEPLSEHDDAEAATEAAVERAGEGATKVLVHDLYSRVHPVAGLGSRRTS